ncbi:bifunctional nicotinamidase/pyrazinamidase [Treponema sp.]
MVIDIARSALIAIDVQNDFCPALQASDGKTLGGALAVSGGNEVVGPLNALAQRFAAEGAAVVATQDWHPENHVSFASSHPLSRVNDIIAIPIPQLSASISTRKEEGPYPAAIEQILWPDHCVQGSFGADFHPKFDLRPVRLVLRKGCRVELDSYSAFFENDRRTTTGLDAYLKGLGIGTVFLGGLATDYCVLYSALDAIRLGYETVLLSDAVRAVGHPEASLERAMTLMREAGVLFLESGSLL